MKRLIVLLVGIGIFLVRLGNLQAQTIWWESGMVKLRQANSGTTGDPIPAGADICTSSGCSKGGVVLSSGRNEFEPFQIMVAAPSGSGLSGVNLKVSDLRDPNGNVIVAQESSGKPKNIVMYREHYLSIDSTKLSSTDGKAGFWPDGLVPKIDEYFGEVRRMPGESTPAFPFNVAANKKQGIWFDVYVPQNTPAGTYTGSVEVTIGGTLKAKVPVKLTVRSFDLPSTPTYKTAYGFGAGEAAMGHYGTQAITDAKYWELICLYTKEMLLHKVSNEGVVWPRLKWDSTQGRINWSLPAISTNCNQRYPEFLTGGNPNLLPNGKLPGAKVTRARMKDGTTLSTTNIQSAAFYKDYVQHFSNMGWKESLYYYLWDEPPWPNTTGAHRCDQNYLGVASSAWRNVYNKSKFFKDNGVDLPMMVTTSRQASEDCFVRYLGVPNYTRYLDIWTVPSKQIDGKLKEGFPFNTNLRASYDSIITTGKQLWWYHGCGSHGCGGSETGFPTPMADLSPIYSRVLQWLAYKYQIGYRAPGPATELYFETVYAYQFPGNDPWKSVYYFSGNGDGTHFYPGTPAKIGGTKHIPIASIRLKMLREGIEDYEYLVQAEAKKNREGVNGEEWVRTKILEPYLSAKDPKDGINKVITYIWNREAGSATSATGLLRAREELAKVLSGQPDPVSGPKFGITASPSSATLLPGIEKATTIAISSQNSFSGGVALSCSTPHPTISCALNSTSLSLAPGDTVQRVLTVKTQGTTPLGNHPVVVTGYAGASVLTTTYTLAVQNGVLSLSDSFDRPNATTLGSNWDEYMIDLEIFNNQIRNKDANSQEAQFTKSIGPNQNASVSCKVTVSGNSCGVMARWSNANNFYYALIDPGMKVVTLFKKVNGVFTKLATAGRTMGYNTFYQISLVTQGSLLKVFFNGESSPAISFTDTSLAGGNYSGIRSYATAASTTYFDNFKVMVP